MPWLELGYFGLFLGTFLAATVIPFSSELIFSGMLIAGFDPITCLLVATAGNTLGGMSSFYLGWLAKWKTLSRWFRIQEQDIQKWRGYSERFGAYLALLCWIPFIGDAIAVALGIFKTHWQKVLFWMAIGKALRYAILLFLWKI